MIGSAMGGGGMSASSSASSSNHGGNQSNGGSSFGSGSINFGDKANNTQLMVIGAVALLALMLWKK